MKKTKLKLLVKMGKGGNFKYNYDVYYNDDYLINVNNQYQYLYYTVHNLL